jgi:DNA-binding transcriptional LysR family regulator
VPSFHGVLSLSSSLLVRPSVAVECNSFKRMYHLIARTAMLGVLPRGMGLQGKAQGHLSVLRYEIGAHFAPVKLIFRKQAATPPGIVRFAQEVRVAARELQLV